MSTQIASRNLCAILTTAAFVCQVASALGQIANSPSSNITVQPVSSASPVGGSVVQAEMEAPAVESFVLPAAHHCWARFPAGAWREIQTTTETFDGSGETVSRSVTTQQESLQSASDERYALDVQATVDLVGKRITGKWINRVLNAITDGTGQIVSSRRLEDATVTLVNQSLTCQVWEVTYSDDTRLLVDHLYYAPNVFPYVLRRETMAESSASDGTPPLEQVHSVVAVEIPYLVEGQLFRCTCLETTRHGEKGSSVRVSLVSEEVPGGEVAVWTTDFDPQGRRSRWSSQELLAYGTEPLPESQRSRRESRRARRQSR